jgi:hypothetical protein
LAERRDIPITESIKNLGIIAKKLQDGQFLNVPGDFVIDGNLTVKGKTNFADDIRIMGNKYLRWYNSGDYDNDINGANTDASIRGDNNGDIWINWDSTQPKVGFGGNLTMQSNKDIEWSNGGQIRADNNGEMWINWDNKKKVDFGGDVIIPNSGKIILEGTGDKKSEIYFNNNADGLEIAQRKCGTLRLYQNGNGFDLDKDTIKKTHGSNIKIEGNVDLNGKLYLWFNGNAGDGNKKGVLYIDEYIDKDDDSYVSWKNYGL